MLPYRDEKTQCRRWWVACAALAAIGAALVMLPLGDPLARLSSDLLFLFHTPARDTNVVVVLEDRDALAALGEKGWPPSRTNHARLLDRLREEGVALVVFDIHFRNERPDEDAVFAEALRRHGNVILGGLPDTSSHQIGIREGAQLTEVKPPTDQLRTNAAAWGLVLAGNLDPRFGVRQMTTLWRGKETAIWQAAVRCGMRAGGTPDMERWINFYGPPPSMDRVTLGEVLQLGGRRMAPGFLRGRVVFVGFDPYVTPASGERDLFMTPYTRFGHEFAPGVEVLANACANLIRGDWLWRVPEWGQGLFAAIFGPLALALLLWVGARRWFRFAGLLVLLFGALALGSLFLHSRYQGEWNWLVPTVVQLPLVASVAVLCPRLPRLAFISYRRVGGDSFAAALRAELRARGYDAFLDVNDLTAGEFPQQLRREIERSPSLILILSPSALDERITRGEDWLRREVAHAFACGKTVIPILLKDFSFEKSAPLPAELQRLPDCQCVTHLHEKWKATIDQLEEFLTTTRAPRP